jgi:hypothetical protein
VNPYVRWVYPAVGVIGVAAPMPVTPMVALVIAFEDALFTQPSSVYACPIVRPVIVRVAVTAAGSSESLWVSSEWVSVRGLSVD